MSAPKDNVNARKWTEKKVIEILAEIEEEAILPEAIYLGSALLKKRLYREIWTYWRKAFSDREEIVQRMIRIEGLFESKLVRAALNGEVVSSVAIFSLKHNHGWCDRPQQAISTVDDGDIYETEDGTLISFLKPVLKKEPHLSLPVHTAGQVLAHLQKLTEANLEEEYYCLNTLLTTHYLNKEVWGRWLETFSGHDEIMESMRMIEATMEMRIYERALKGDFVAGVAIFVLKNNHYWRDKKGETGLRYVRRYSVLDLQEENAIKIG